MQSVLTSEDQPSVPEVSRARTLQTLGILSGLTAGAWLGAAEAAKKLAAVGRSPMVISLVMGIGLLLARWSLPALILGTSPIRRRSPPRARPHHLRPAGRMHVGG